MHKVVARRLRPYEGRTLRHMKRQHSNAVNSRHAQIILLSRGGLANREIAEWSWRRFSRSQRKAA